MKTSLPFTLRSDFQGRAGPSSTPHPFTMQCQLRALPPRCHFLTDACLFLLPDGSRVPNKLPNFSFPLGIPFQCYLVTSVFFQLDDVQELPPEVTNLQLLWPVRPPCCRNVPKQRRSLMLCCAPAAQQRWGPLCWGLQAALSLVFFCITELTLSSLGLFCRASPGSLALFNMAQEEEWLQNTAENWSQAVISFHRCPPVTFSAELQPFAFSTSKWGLPAFQ